MYTGFARIKWPRLRVAGTMALICICSACSSDDQRQQSEEQTNRRHDNKQTQTTNIGPRKEAPGSPPQHKKQDEKSSDLQKVAAVPTQEPRSSAAVQTTEVISGYKTQAEYITVASRTRPDNIAAVMLPLDYGRSSKKYYPLVIVFGGAGECARPPRDGALAWIRYYKTDEAVEALKRNKLNQSDFRDLVTNAQLKQFNRKLNERPYSGMIIVCPASPLVVAAGGPDYPGYEDYIMKDLLPVLMKKYRVAEGAVGVDGVSMGGARAMYYGFKYPQVFAGIGSSQGAFGPFMDIYTYLVERNAQTLKKRAIQLVTSDKDGMAPSVNRMHKMLTDHGIGHEYLVLKGPHDYIFNQGPGSISLLVFHNSALQTHPSN